MMNRHFVHYRSLILQKKIFFLIEYTMETLRYFIIRFKQNME